MIETLLNADERQVYAMDRFRRMTKGQISNELSKKDPSFSVEKVQSILNEIDRKAYVKSRYTILLDLTYKYWRIFRVTKEYLKEKDEGIKHVFNIDYSDIYVYLNPLKAVERTLNRNVSLSNLGSIHYMFNSKHTNKFCLLPPAVWELINRTYATAELTDNKVVPDFFKKNYKGKRMSSFFDLIKNWDGTLTETFSRDLMSRYLAAGDWLEILALASEEKLDKRLEHNYLNIKNLLGPNNRIQTIEDNDFGIDLNKVNLDDATYTRALQKLGARRPFNRDINNRIDAANVAMTYDLTKDTENKTYYRFISHSKHVSEAFNDITLKPEDFNDATLKQMEHDEVNLACCPQLVSLLSLIENKQIAGINNDDTQQMNEHLDECIGNLGKMHYQLENLKHIRNAWYLEREILHIGNTLGSVLSDFSKALQEYLKESAKFKEKIYPSFIEHIMDINSGVKKADINYDASFKEDLGYLEDIFKNQKRYTKLVKDIFDLVYLDAEKTLKLYEDKLLTDDMRTLMERLTEQMDK